MKRVILILTFAIVVLQANTSFITGNAVETNIIGYKYLPKLAAGDVLKTYKRAYLPTMENCVVTNADTGAIRCSN